MAEDQNKLQGQQFSYYSLYMFTSLSSVFVAVVMTPLFESMLNMPSLSRRVYLSLTWSVPFRSLSEAITVPTTVPMELQTITSLTVAVKHKGLAEFFNVLFLTYFAFLSYSAQYWTVDCWRIIIHIVHFYDDGQGVVRLPMGSNIINLNHHL